MTIKRVHEAVRLALTDEGDVQLAGTVARALAKATSVIRPAARRPGRPMRPAGDESG